MPVGPNFNNAETQAAIAAQSTNTPVTPAAEPVTPVVKPVEPVKPASETPADEAAKVVKPAETPSATEPKTDESAASPNMDEGVKPTTPEQVSAALKKAGFSEQDIADEYAKNRKLSDETVAKLKEHFPEDVVDKSIADMKERFESALTDHDADVAKKNAAIDKDNELIFGTLAGGDVEKGKEHFKTLSTWARANLDEKQIALINKKLASGDQDLIIDGLTQAVTAWKKGQRKSMMTGDSLATNNGTVVPEFKPLSRDEFKQIMATDKYNTDLEYQASIDARRRKTMEGEGFRTIEYSASRPPIQ